MTEAGLYVLDGLVDHELVAATDGRLTMLEPIRQYAVQRLDAAPDAEAIRARYAAHYLALAEETRQELWQRATASPAYGRLHLERDNLRAALTWALEHHHATTAVALAGAIDPYLAASAAYAELSDRLPACPGDRRRHRSGSRCELAPRQAAPTRRIRAVVVEQGLLALELYRILGDDRGIGGVPDPCLDGLFDARLSAAGRSRPPRRRCRTPSRPATRH